MRPMEWLVLLAFLPFVLQPFVPQRPRGGVASWLPGALPALCSLLQLALEGGRTQMIPLYLLAVSALFLQGRLRKRRPGRGLRTVFGVLVAGSALLPAWALPVFQLGRPSGAYLVGVTEREVAVRPGRRLMTTVWYPASARSAPAPLTREPAQIATGLGQAFGVPAAAPFLQHLRYVKVTASTDAPAAARTFPVLVFSPGLTGLRLQSSETFQDLASHGFVVVALDHTDAAAVTVFPDGEVRPFNLARFGIRPDQTERSTELLLPHWMNDQRAAYDALASWNVSDALLGGHLDLGRVASFGHSFGGVTAVEVCRVEPRCRAAANLDGGWARGLPPHGSPKPLLLISAQASAALPQAMQHWRQLMALSSDHPVWLELPNSNHLSFTLTPRLSPLLSPRGYRLEAGQRSVDGALRSFFRASFAGHPETFLTGVKGRQDLRLRHPTP